MPNYNFLHALVWWLLLGIVAVPVIYLCMDYMSQDIFLIALIVWGLYMAYFIFDLIFRIPVKYIFYKSEKSISRKNIISRKIMNFDEMTYFIKDESGGYCYAIGKRKRQFIKNYRISNYFSNSKVSQKKENEYLENILFPVLKLVGIAIQNEK
ncbi:hypothetical protein M2T82_00465 [Elizabethkingia ursingii]|uniref:hypothetical protein n=1 Tax=Elizabethkingia ursingii TaxID=1756150 RepID=UPI002012700D|nr:hypothetical protein [Elizabethkingia ursingii]MCL1666526.1 hypothetical protein [Elizabethkingia ursingii]